MYYCGMMFVNPLEYPKSDTFIQKMSTESMERILKLGWLTENTLFFEIPYCAMSGVGSGIVRDYEHQVYYNMFYATEGVISVLSDAQLRVVTDHEQDEVAQMIHNAKEDSLKTAFTSLDEETKRHDIEMQPIEMRYGKAVVDGTLRSVMEAASTKVTIPRYVLLFWVSSYLLVRFDQFTLFSSPMTSAMLLAKQRSFFMQNLQLVVKEYGSNAPIKEYTQLYLSALQKC